MSQKTYVAKGEVSDTPSIISDIAGYWERFYISIVMYSDEFKTISESPSGIAIFTASDDGVRYGTITNGTVNLSMGEYARPNLSGKIQSLKIQFSGVAGATHFKANINAFN